METRATIEWIIPNMVTWNIICSEILQTILNIDEKGKVDVTQVLCRLFDFVDEPSFYIITHLKSHRRTRFHIKYFITLTHHWNAISALAFPWDNIVWLPTKNDSTLNETKHFLCDDVNINCKFNAILLADSRWTSLFTCPTIL